LICEEDSAGVDGSAMRGQKVEVDIPRGEIAAFCERHHIRKLAVFGSVLRDDLRADSRASIKRNSN